MSDHEKARELFLRGIEQFESKQLDAACLSFEAALNLAPGRPSILQNLGKTQFLLGKDSAAITTLQQATAADPAMGDNWLYLGLALQRSERWKEAATSLSHALALRPDDHPLHLACAVSHYRSGNTAEALNIYDLAIQRSPAPAAIWIEKANLLREIGRLEEAGKCFAEAAKLGANDDLSRYYLSAVTRTDTPSAPPRPYVEALFDDYADKFQDHLVETLGYCGHTSLCQPLQLDGRRYSAVLDLGCGTGLSGQLMHNYADAIDGVDLSKAMLQQAKNLGIYRELQHADLTEHLAAVTSKYDLVLATDVFVYVGDLSEVFAGVRKTMLPGGLFAFTVEKSNGPEFELQPSLRYTHSENYLRRLADEHGFVVSKIWQAPLRQNKQQAVQGLYTYLTLAE